MSLRAFLRDSYVMCHVLGAPENKKRGTKMASLNNVYSQDGKILVQMVLLFWNNAVKTGKGPLSGNYSLLFSPEEFFRIP